MSRALPSEAEVIYWAAHIDSTAAARLLRVRRPRYGKSAALLLISHALDQDFTANGILVVEEALK